MRTQITQRVATPTEWARLADKCTVPGLRERFLAGEIPCYADAEGKHQILPPGSTTTRQIDSAPGPIVARSTPRPAPAPATPSPEQIHVDGEARAAKALRLCEQLGGPSDGDEIAAVLALGSRP